MRIVGVRAIGFRAIVVPTARVIRSELLLRRRRVPLFLRWRVALLGRSRRRCLRLGLRLSRRPARAAPEFGEWIALPDQTGELGERIAGACLLVGLRRFRRAPLWIGGAIGS
jgi:hypothetical protein